MAVHVRDVICWIEERAPQDRACDWDQVGLQIGDPSQAIQTVLVALDFNTQVLREATQNEAQMVVVHHPVFFRPMSSFNPAEPLVKLLAAALAAQVAVYVAHTNLDQAADGVSQVLAEQLGLTDISPLPGTELGKGAMLPEPMTLAELVNRTARVLPNPALRYFGDGEQMIDRVAVCGGSGGGLVVAAVQWGAQVLITGDIGYHDLLEAHERKLNLVDAGHAETEQPLVANLAEYLSRRAGEEGLELHCLTSRIPAPQWDANHEV